MIDDSQVSERRDPAHSDLESQISRVHLDKFDPSKLGGKPVGKTKRIRAVLSAALADDEAAGETLAKNLISMIRGFGGFRSGSSNYCGAEAILNLIDAYSASGWELLTDGTLSSKTLPAFGSKHLTAALRIYADRARRGALDSPLLVGTAKDLLEATAAHVLTVKWGSYSSAGNFPTLLGQAFTALNWVTPSSAAISGEPVQARVQRTSFELACALNALRNREGTGHGRPWISNVKPHEARLCIESMGSIASCMLDELG